MGACPPRPELARRTEVTQLHDRMTSEVRNMWL